LQALSPTKYLLKEESTLRKKITSLGVKHGGKITTDAAEEKPSSRKKGATREEEIEQCYYCNYLLYLSMVWLNFDKIMLKKFRGVLYAV